MYLSTVLFSCHITICKLNEYGTTAIESVLWLEHGYLAGDDTDSHVDTLARLVPYNCIIYQSCDDPADEHYTELTAMAEELASLRTREGHPFKLLPLPWPVACHADDGHRLPATYANFLIPAILCGATGHGMERLEMTRQCELFIRGCKSRIILLNNRGNVHDHTFFISTRRLLIRSLMAVRLSFSVTSVR
jgi:hypothetical protein